MSASDSGIIRYQLPGDWTVLAGASDADNDRLSVRLADPEDYWFHAQGVSGSHVILRAKPDEAPGKVTIRQAAAIAAHHSKARNARNAQVHYTRARYVKKRRGSKRGTVEVTRGSVLKVRPDISFATRIRGEVDPDE